MNWREILFGAPRQATKPQAQVEAGAPSGGDGAEAVYQHVPQAELRSSQQHAWLFDDGVVHWNQHRRDREFKPSFAGVNFVKEAAKTRLFGRPVDLIGAERVMLAGVDWSNAELQGCILTKADLRNARLRGADMRNVNLAGALLNGADLTDADLRGANLDGAQFARAKLTHANLAGTSCKNTNFAWADLSQAVVGERNLSEANLFGVVRDGVKFEKRLLGPPPMAWPMAYQHQQAALPRPAGEIRA